jgi:Ca2+-dependent lipid-binding protein
MHTHLTRVFTLLTSTPMAQNYSLLSQCKILVFGVVPDDVPVQSADQIAWDPGFLRRGPKLYVTVKVDGVPVEKTRVFKRSLKPEWNFRANL